MFDHKFGFAHNESSRGERFTSTQESRTPGRTIPQRNNVLTLLASLALLLAICPASHAGYWVKQDVPSPPYEIGQFDSQYYPPRVTTEMPAPIVHSGFASIWGDDDIVWGNAMHGTNYPMPIEEDGGYCSVTQDGVATLTFVWVPNAGKDMVSDPPPAKTVVHETAVVYAGSSASDSRVLDGTYSASTGFDPEDEVAIVDQQWDVQYPYLVFKYAKATGERYEMKDSSSGSFQVQTYISAEVSAQCFGNVDRANGVHIESRFDADIPTMMNFYHGTWKDVADQFVGGMAVDDRGSADFGRGWYTVDDNGKGQLATMLAFRSVRKRREGNPSASGEWGVVKFSIPWLVYQKYLYDNTASTVLYDEACSDASGEFVPDNAPWFTLGMQQPNFAARPIPFGPMTWFNFAWNNWFIYDSAAPSQNALGSNDGSNYVPVWLNSPSDLPNYNRFLIRGHFFQPNRWQWSVGGGYPVGEEWDGAGGLWQWVWNGEGISMFNDPKRCFRTIYSHGNVDDVQ